ncbi:MAG TPA: DMT family transporter [Tepidisphaeraceae bacterium]|jgi:drug/metabolite transporter (DMT)-like permease|nr:DMT family transporter [Tepidisphaeraceae bacterium]
MPAQSVHYVLLITAVMAGSTAVVMIKSNTMPPVLLASYRVLLAAVMLSPLFFRARAKQRASGLSVTPMRQLLVRSGPGAAMLALHFISWNTGARLTGAANAALVVNMVPVVMPFLMWAAMGEIITRREIIGSILALAGVLVLTAGDYHLGGPNLLGDVICFGSMLMMALYMLAARRYRSEGESLWLYIVPLYWMAGFFCFFIGLCIPTARPLFDYSARDYALLFALAAGPTVVGHTLLNNAMRHLRGQVVSIFNLGQFVFAGVLAFIFIGEVPKARFYLASALVVAGGVIVVMRSRPKMQQMQKEAALIED